MTEQMTAAQYQLWTTRRNKYGAKTAYRCNDCGGWANKTVCLTCQSHKILKFASKAEAKRYDFLRDRQEHDLIQSLVLQPEYPIYIKGKLICKVVLDFSYSDPWELHVEDVKGMDNALSRLKRKLVEASYGFKVELIK